MSRLDEEVEAHLDLLTAKHVSRGLSPDEARAAARRDFGGVQSMRERYRDQRIFASLTDAHRDLVHAWRSLVRAPVFALVVVFTLAIGIGANTAIFLLINSLALRTLPVDEPERLAMVTGGLAIPRADDVQANYTYATWESLRNRAALFDGATAWAGTRFDLANGGLIEPVAGLYASGTFFTTLGVRAAIGRTFDTTDDTAGAASSGPVAVISHRFWRRRFGGSPATIGTMLMLERVPFTIIGVTPPAFFGMNVGGAFDVAVPLAAEPLIRRGGPLLANPSWFLRMTVRLKPGQTLSSATDALRGVQPQMREDLVHQGAPSVAGNDGFLKDPLTLQSASFGVSALRTRYIRPLLTLFVVAISLLLIASINISNLMLARASARRHELSVRLALGASGWRIAQQLMVESFLLAGTGAGLGLLFAQAASAALIQQLSIQPNPMTLDVPLDWRVLAFAAGVAILATMIVGVAPAIRAARLAPVESLKEQGRAGSGTAVYAVSSTLVTAQVALSLALVVTAGLFVRTFVELATVPIGFDADRVLLVNVTATRSKVDRAERLALFERLTHTVGEIPGVAHAAASLVTPVSGGMSINMISVPGAPAMSEFDRVVMIHFVTPGWFATYGTPIRSGRDFDDHDTPESEPVTLVNEAFVRKFLAGTNPLGAVVGPGRGNAPPKRIVGVVQDAVYLTLRKPSEPTMFVPLAQSAFPSSLDAISIGVRAESALPNRLMPAVTKALRDVDPDLGFTFRQLDDQVSASLFNERLLARLSIVFGALAMILAGVGLYGVTHYAVTRRRAEIGIRMALGAQPSAVLGLVLRRLSGIVLVGIISGLTAAAAATQYASALLFGVTPRDPVTFVGAALLFALVAMIAAFVPARRATKVDPLVALRYE